MQLEINQGFRENATDRNASRITSVMGYEDQIKHLNQS